MTFRKCTLVALLVVAGCGDPAPDQRDLPITANQTVTVETQDDRAVVRLAPDERLFYVDAAPREHFGGLLSAGARVDLLAFFEEPQGTTAEDAVGPIAQLVLQNVAVVDTSTPDPGHKARLGFALTPDEVQMLALMERTAELLVLARNPEDAAIRPATRTSLADELEDLEVMQERRQLRSRSAAHSDDPSDDEFLSSIPPEERAVAVHTGLPADALRAGDRLDVLAVFGPESGAAAPVALTLLQSVQILRVLHDGLAVLALTVEEAEALGLAERRGELEFVARSPIDHEVSHVMKKTLREVVDDLEIIQEKRTLRARKKPKKKVVSSIQIIRGGGALTEPQAEESTETYAHYGVNPSYDPKQDPTSTFAADVDTASYTNTRRFIREGAPVPPSAIRVEEFVNYFPYDYPVPENGPFGVTTEIAPSPFSSDARTKLLRIGVQGETISPAERKPVHLVFLVDVSGSMQDDDRLPLAKKALRYMTHNLRDTDTVAIATYSGETVLALEPTPATHRKHILEAIDSLTADGGTAMGDGLSLAYRLAAQTLQDGHENRVLVLSDGDANIGDTSWDEMLDRIESEVDRGITMTTVGFGRGNYQDTTMEQLANRGNGNYYYVDSLEEAKRVFGGQLDGTLRTIARDVKIQVEFNPNAVRTYRLVGYENRALADKDFRNDDADGGEIGAGHQVTALYEVVVGDDTSQRLATVRVRHTPVEGGEAVEATFDVDRSTMKPSLAASSADFRFAASVAAFAEVLRENPHADKLSLKWIAEVADGAIDGRPERSEFLELLAMVQ